MATPAGLVVEHQTPDQVVPGSIPGGAVEFLCGAARVIGRLNLDRHHSGARKYFPG